VTHAKHDDRPGVVQKPKDVRSDPDAADVDGTGIAGPVLTSSTDSPPYVFGFRGHSFPLVLR